MDGLWTAEFGSTAGRFGGGVVILKDGIVMGGDGGFYYTGTYELKGNTVIAKIEATAFIEGYPSILGTTIKSFTIELAGTLVDPSHIVAQGSFPGLPSIRVGIKLTKRG